MVEFAFNDQLSTLQSKLLPKSQLHQLGVVFNIWSWESAQETQSNLFEPSWNVSNRRRSEVNTYDIAHNCVAEDLDERIFSQDTLLLVNLHLNKGNTASITWIGGRIKYLFVF